MLDQKGSAWAELVASELERLHANQAELDKKQSEQNLKILAKLTVIEKELIRIEAGMNSEIIRLDERMKAKTGFWGVIGGAIVIVGWLIIENLLQR